jgi:UDP-sugar transporter A1/2/3
MLKTKISHQKIVALCSLTVGMILAQREHVEENIHSVHSHITLKRQSTSGITFVLAAALTSGFAGTYVERMYKEGSTTSSNCSIWSRNAQLALFSLPSALLTSYVRDSERISILGPFYGYDAIIIIVIALQALGGLVTAAVMRYASNVLKCFAVSASICNCVVVSFLVEGRAPRYAQVLGIIIVIWSTFSYILDIH